MENKIQNRTSLITFLLLATIIIGLFLKMILPYMIAILMGAILAVLLNPFYKVLNKRKWQPTAAALIVTLILIVIIVGPVATFVTLATKQGVTLSQNLADSEDLSYDAIASELSRFEVVRGVLGEKDLIESQIRGAVKNAGKTVGSSIVAIVSLIPAIILQIVLAVVTCFFFLVDGKKFTDWIFERIPIDQDVEKKLRGSFLHIASSAVEATLAAAAAQSLTILVGFLILGVPGVFFAAGATFILAWIPILGSTPVWVVGALYLFHTGAIVKGIIMIAIGLFAGIVDNIVRPLVLRGRGDMHTLLSLVAVFGGISMFGILGVFVGPILASIVLGVLEIWPVVGHRVGIILDAPDKSKKVSGK